MVTMLDMVCVYLWICYDVHFVCKSVLLLAACRLPVVVSFLSFFASLEVEDSMCGTGF